MMSVCHNDALLLHVLTYHECFLVFVTKCDASSDNKVNDIVRPRIHEVCGRFFTACILLGTAAEQFDMMLLISLSYQSTDNISMEISMSALPRNTDEWKSTDTGKEKSAK
jgi:hypothetical protein